MNAHTPLSARTTAMPFDGPAAGVGDLSRTDLSLGEVVKDAEHELRHCVSDHDCARWARRWGERAIVRLRDAEAFDEDAWVSKATFDETDKALGDLIRDATKAADEITATLKDATGPKTEAINLSLAALREAIENAEIEE